jgi:hypothetical protein
MTLANYLISSIHKDANSLAARSAACLNVVTDGPCWGSAE